VARVNYREGDWFAVPLEGGGYAVGVVARANPNGILLGYFYGPRRMEPPLLADLAALHAADAVLVARFSSLGLVDGSWPIVGQKPGWDRGDWPTPMFVRHEELTGRWIKVFYDADDPAKLLGEEVFTPNGIPPGPNAGLMGPGFVEKRLSRLIGSGSASDARPA
jgi:hypothetical protein